MKSNHLLQYAISMKLFKFKEARTGSRTLAGDVKVNEYSLSCMSAQILHSELFSNLPDRSPWSLRIDLPNAGARLDLNEIVRNSRGTQELYSLKHVTVHAISYLKLGASTSGPARFAS